MSLESILTSFFSENIIALSFFAGLLLGDFVLFLGILAGAGKANILLVFLFAFIGGLVHDSIFYFLSNSSFGKKIKDFFKLSKKKNRLAYYLETFSYNGSNYFIPVFLSKFIYGVRDIVLFYYAGRIKNFGKFLSIFLPAEFFWMLTLSLIGWLAGRGMTLILYLFKGVEKWLFFVICGIFLYFLVVKKIFKFIYKLKKSS